MSENRRTTGGKGLKELDSMFKSATKATPQHKTAFSLDESKEPISAADGTTADKAVSVAYSADDSEPDADAEQSDEADNSDGDNHDVLENEVESEQSEDEEAVEEASSDAHTKYTNRSYTPEAESVCDDSDDDMFEAIYQPMTARKNFILKCELELMDDQQYEEAFHILMNLCPDELEEPRLPVPHETVRALLGLCASIECARDHPDAVEESPQQPPVTFREKLDIAYHFYDFTPWIQDRFVEMISLHRSLDSNEVDARKFPNVLLRLLLRHVRLRVGFHEKANERSEFTTRGTINGEESMATDPSVMTAAASAATVAPRASGQPDGKRKLASNKRKRDEVEPEERDDNPSPKKRANVATVTEISTDNESDGTENSITSEAVKKAKAQASSDPKTAPAANSKKATKAQSQKKRSRDAASEDEFDDAESDNARKRVKTAAPAAVAQDTSTTVAPTSAVKKTAQTPRKRARKTADDDEAEEAEEDPAPKRAKKSSAASTRNSTPTANSAKPTKKPTKRQQNTAATEDENFVEEEKAPTKPRKKAAARKTTDAAATTTKRALKRATKSAAAQKKDTVDSAAAAEEGNDEKQFKSGQETERFSSVANLDGTVGTSSNEAALDADLANSDAQFVEEF